MFLSNHDIHNHNTRNRNLSHVPVARTEIVYKTFQYRGVHIWNDILIHIDVNTSLIIFKKLLYHHMSNSILQIRYQP